RIEHGKLRESTIDLRAFDHAVNCLSPRAGGGVIAGMNGGAVLNIDANGRASLLATPPSPPGAVIETSDLALWGGSVDGSVWTIRNGQVQVIDHELHERIVALLESGDRIWIASLGSGAMWLDRRDPSTHAFVHRAQGLLGETLW